MIGTPSLAPFDVIYSMDPALARPARADFGDDASYTIALKSHVEELERHAEGSLATAQLPLVPGGKLTIFRCQALRRRAFLKVLETSEIERSSVAVAFGLLSVDGFRHGGEIIGDLARESSPCGERLTDAALEQLFNPFLFAELASRILRASELVRSPF